MLLVRTILLFAALSSFAPALLFAQFPMPTTRSLEDTTPADIHELVSKYCRFDYEGARLDPQGWSKLQPLVSWPSSPNFSHIDVVARYTVDMPSQASHGKSSVTVHYRLLGIFDLTTGYVPEPQVVTQDVNFLVSSDNSGLRITDAENTSPHPSRATMLKWLSTKIGTAEDDAAKTRYEDALKQLQAQSASPFAK